jgi:hypothetical protein
VMLWGPYEPLWRLLMRISLSKRIARVSDIMITIDGTAIVLLASGATASMLTTTTVYGWFHPQPTGKRESDDSSVGQVARTLTRNCEKKQRATDRTTKSYSTD